MARTLSWIDRIVPISRAVAASAQSHYGRKDLERLFEIQSRSAQTLMASMPIVSIGKSHLVEREALRALLRRLNEAKDPTKALALLRSKAAKSGQRKLRVLSLSEGSVDVDTPPENLTLNRGEMTVRFKTIEQLAETMLYLAALLQDHLDDFAANYEPLRELVGEEVKQKEECHSRNDSMSV